ncbi:MAG: hypothetical protein V1754_14085 [Pseudomonadota bacterium]
MKTRAILSLCVLGLAIGVMSGCDEDPNFYVYQNQVPGDQCVVAADENVYRPEGVLDVSKEVGYVMFPLLRNDLPPIYTSGDEGRLPEPNMLQMQKFEVKLDLSDLSGSFSSSLRSFNQITTGVLNPGDKRASWVKIIPDELAKKINIKTTERPQIVATVVAVAESGMGEIVRSLPFMYPITLCNGCLVKNLSTCDPEELPVGLVSQVCGLPQDNTLYCCVDAILGPRCFAGMVQ